MLKTCSICGKEFEGNARATACPECKSHILHRALHPEYGVCPTCGLDFIPKNKRMKCCSPECASEYNRVMTAYNRNKLAPEDGGSVVGIYDKLHPDEKKVPPEESGKRIDQANAKAREMGLSYGQYKAKERMGMIEHKKNRRCR